LSGRQPLDLGDALVLQRSGASIWFTVGGSVHAAAALA
jgi:hypothetical protein